MAFVTWTDAYSVKVKLIDDQHKKLFKMINEFHESSTQDNKNAMERILNSLVDYTDFHFQTEERFFDKFGYSETDGHKRMHKGFVNKVLDAKKRFDAGKGISVEEITKFLKDWLIQHIMAEDKKYMNFFKENGFT